jgi:hypothetical protein
MQKFDSTCGLSTKEIGIIKFQVKKSISSKLPLLPESIETRLFFQGRDAWVFKWYLLNEKLPISPDDKISLEVVAILKKEYHKYQDKTHYRFLYNATMDKGDEYHPKISIV